MKLIVRFDYDQNSTEALYNMFLSALYATSTYLKKATVRLPHQTKHIKRLK